MGSENVHGLTVASLFDIRPSPEDRGSLFIVPFSSEILEERKDTHILVAMYPPSIREMYESIFERSSILVQSLFPEGGDKEDLWWYDEFFATRSDNKVAFWKLIRKYPIPNSVSASWRIQDALLEKRGEAALSAREVVYILIVHYYERDEWLYEDVFIRTTDTDDAGRHICVGFSNQFGRLTIGAWRESSYRVGITGSFEE